MLLQIHCIDFTSDIETIELCSFRGIRFDRRNGCVILSTEHERHDYIFPMDYPAYERLVGEINALVKQNVPLMGLENGHVFRCRKGELRRDSAQDKMTAVAL